MNFSRSECHVANVLRLRKRGWEVDRIFGDLEDTEEEEVKINQRNTGDSDDLSAAKGETKENLNDEGKEYHLFSGRIATLIRCR
jgi:hypothetical protein